MVPVFLVNVRAAMTPSDMSSIPLPRLRMKNDGKSVANVGARLIIKPEAAIINRPTIMHVFVPMYVASFAENEQARRYPIEFTASIRPSWNSVMPKSACMRGMAGPRTLSESP
jgi:hypothetical protein